MLIVKDKGDVGYRHIQDDNEHIFAIKVGVYFHKIRRP